MRDGGYKGRLSMVESNKEPLEVEPQAVGSLKEPGSKPLPEALEIVYGYISLTDAISSYEKANKEIPSWLKGGW